MKVLFYPDGANKRWSITKARHYVDLCGVDITSNPNDSFDSVIYWSYHKGILPLDDVLIKLQESYDIINIGCWDITKTHNEQCMKEAFGYNSLVDPFTEKEFCEKSELQGRHEINILKKPIKQRKDGYLYVKLIDNRISENVVRDYRIFLDEKDISFVLITDKLLKDRFKGQLSSTNLELRLDPLSCFSEQEIDSVYEYCRCHGSHFTELDIVRDKDGKMYIIDNNNVPAYAATLRLLLEKTSTFGLLVDSFYKTIKAHAV